MASDDPDRISAMNSESIGTRSTLTRLSSLAFRIPFVVLFLVACRTAAHGDALVVTRAMKASTIMEVFVEASEVRVELEIGGNDLEAFQDLLPDQIYKKLTGKSLAAAERRIRFIEQFPIVADGITLDGKVTQTDVVKRVVRDEFTGDPLPIQPEDSEIVLNATLLYSMNPKPDTIVIVGPNDDVQVSIGFVAYHKGVAVNDFRYLSGNERLHVDWEDPWYSAFERKTLRRQFAAPAAAFVYIENFEVRKEIVIRPKDLQRWIDLGLEDKQFIAAADRESICARAATYLGEHTPVKIDGKDVHGTLDRVHFIRRTLRSTGVVEPETDIPIDTGMIGAIFVYPRDELPQSVSISWDLFDSRIQTVPTIATDQAGGMPGMLTPDSSQLKWKNYLKNPTLPAFANVRPPPEGKSLPLPVATVLCFVAAALATKLVTADRLRRSIISALMVAGVVAAFIPAAVIDVPYQRPAELSQAETTDITSSLLYNVYRAFDYRDESAVYDILERSTIGELLDSVYLETRKSLTLASQGGAKVKVDDVEMVSCESEPRQDGAFSAKCTWVVSGSVGHWGHIHQRKNRYDGEFIVKVVDGRWKLTNMTVLQEERI